MKKNLKTSATTDMAMDDRMIPADRFDDIIVLCYRLDGFEKLTPGEKELAYYLSEAALSGRDIIWVQNFRYNLEIRKILETVLEFYPGDRSTNEFGLFMLYCRKVFFANGIHHHYSNEKFTPGFSLDFLREAYRLSMAVSKEGEINPVEAVLPVHLEEIIFDPSLFQMRSVQTDGQDMVALSAVNFYEGVTQAEAEDFYGTDKRGDDLNPVARGLNTRLVRKDGSLTEEVWKSGGLYGDAIDRVIHWLEKARKAALNERQEKEISLLISFYLTGDLSLWDTYSIAWVGNTGLTVDYINGFIETYTDPMGIKATWEGLVQFRDHDASERIAKLTANAQWFEDHSPIDPVFRKENVTGVHAGVVNVVMLGGDCYPASPLGINLPNSNWIRAKYGSKSVSLANIKKARDAEAERSGLLGEFIADSRELERAVRYGQVADALHTDLHECIGHASGKLAPGTDPSALKNYASPLEEMRADLFALWFMPDDKLITLGLADSQEIAMAEYDSYVRNGLLTQLARISPGKEIEQAHMRCRSAICRWALENGKEERVIELVTVNGKSYTRVNDYSLLRSLFGRLLREVQRIKSEGDFQAARSLIENFGVRVDPVLHAEVIDRYSKLDIAPFTGFVNPCLSPVYGPDGNMTDVRAEYCHDFLAQALDYGKRYSFLK